MTEGWRQASGCERENSCETASGCLRGWAEYPRDTGVAWHAIGALGSVFQGSGRSQVTVPEDVGCETQAAHSCGSRRSGTGRAAFEVHGNSSEILPGGFPHQDPSPRVPARGRMPRSYKTSQAPSLWDLGCCLLAPDFPASVGCVEAARRGTGIIVSNYTKSLHQALGVALTPCHTRRHCTFISGSRE